MSAPIVIFDLDETLMFEEPSNIKAYQHTAALAAQHGITDQPAFINAAAQHAERLWQAGYDYHYWDSLGLASWEGLWSDFTGNCDRLNAASDWVKAFRVQTWHDALQQFKIDNQTLAQQLAQNFYQQRRKHHVIFDQTIDLLKKLHGTYPLGIITNGSHDIQWNKINAINIAPYFDHIVISGELGIGKPNAQLFNHTLALFNAAPDQAVMIGNSLCRDIQGAHNARMKSVLIKTTDPEASVDITPTAAIDTLDQLPPLLKQWF